VALLSISEINGIRPYMAIFLLGYGGGGSTTEDRGSIPGKRLFTITSRLCDPGIKLPERDYHRSGPYNAKVKNAWRYMCTLPHNSVIIYAKEQLHVSVLTYVEMSRQNGSHANVAG
jgi:hypothetical protein